MIKKCPLKVNQLIFEIKRIPGPETSTPSIIGWTVVDITDDPDSWYAIVSHRFEGESGIQTRTITPRLWQNIYHPNTTAAVIEEIRKNRKLIGDLYITIDSLKQYLHDVEGLGILVKNNNKQNNPLEIDIF